MTHSDEDTAPEAVTQTWWLSFSDPARPQHRQFLGVAIVDVEPEDADEALEFVRARRAEVGLVTGTISEHARYIGGAVRVAHEMGCNPGGQVHATRIDTDPGFATRDAAGNLPRNRLMSLPELQRVGAL